MCLLLLNSNQHERVYFIQSYIVGPKHDRSQKGRAELPVYKTKSDRNICSPAVKVQAFVTRKVTHYS